MINCKRELCIYSLNTHIPIGRGGRVVSLTRFFSSSYKIEKISQSINETKKKGSFIYFILHTKQ